MKNEAPHSGYFVGYTMNYPNPDDNHKIVVQMINHYQNNYFLIMTDTKILDTDLPSCPLHPKIKI